MRSAAPPYVFIQGRHSEERSDEESISKSKVVILSAARGLLAIHFPEGYSTKTRIMALVGFHKRPCGRMKTKDDDLPGRSPEESHIYSKDGVKYKKPLPLMIYLVEYQIHREGFGEG